MHKYFLGEILPPHLSPFMKEERRIGDYVPPEEKKLLGLEEHKKDDNIPKELINSVSEHDTKNDAIGSEENESTDEESEEALEEESEEALEEEGDRSMKVVEGKPQNVNKAEEKLMEDEQYRLRVMMVRRKHRGLYRSMMKARKKRVHESKQLDRKRKMYDQDKNSVNSESEKIITTKKKNLDTLCPLQRLA